MGDLKKHLTIANTDRALRATTGRVLRLYRPPIAR
jgi:hypothetical protein